MANVILVTGGTRSGKSLFAQKLAEALPPPHCFVATCGVSDEEMAQRIKKHQQERSERIWTTIEEPVDLKRSIQTDVTYSVYLIDCLTLWISNLMQQYDLEQKLCKEEDVRREVELMFDTICTQGGTYMFVSNEVGMGIVPENRVARQYRDLVGFCNRLIAEHAQEVILVSCGLPLYLKRA